MRLPMPPFARSPSATDVNHAVQIYRRRTIVVLQICFLLGASVGLALFHETPPVRYATIISMLCSSASLWLARREQLNRSVAILAVQFLLLPFGLAMTALGVYDSGMLISPAGMVAIAVVAPPLVVGTFSLLNVGCAGIVVVTTINGGMGDRLPREMLHNAPVDGVTLLLVLIFCGIVATYISYVLTTLLEVLIRHQNELEGTVARRTADLTRSNSELREALHVLDHARDELVRSEKLSSLGSLVAGVAHELNTPIGNATVAASTMRERIDEFGPKLDSGDLRRRDIDDLLAMCRNGSDLVLRSLERSRDLVASFKQVAVDQSSERRREFLLHEVIGDVLNTLRPSLAGKPWQVSSDTPPGITCDGYPGPLGQVVTNLVQNAIIHGFHDREDGIVHIAVASEGDWLRIEVSDNGVGIPANVIGKIFDPFFTTRLGQGGSGLGLAICHNIVTSLLGGQIAVSSTRDTGTTFTLRLPRRAPLPEHT